MTTRSAVAVDAPHADVDVPHADKGQPRADNGNKTLPCRKKATEMPKVSRDTTTQGGDYGAVVDRSEEFGDYTVDFLTFREDVDHRPLLKGLPDDRCQCPHWGYVFRGELTFHYADHDEVYHQGDAFYAPAGHVPVHTEPGSEYLQISPSDELRRTSEVIMKNYQSLREQG